MSSDELPPILDTRRTFSNTTNKKSIDDLFERSCCLIYELGIEKQVQEDAEALSPSPNFDIIEQENSLEVEGEEADYENKFLKRTYHPQYFSMEDITLKSCGYNYKGEMSTDEQILFALEPHELFELIRTDNVCRNILNVNALVHFLIKSMSLHSDAAVIFSSQILIKSLVADCEDICFTYEDIFQILFNCSADVSTSEIFKILKPYRLVSPTCTSSETIPEYWLLNLKAALCSLNDILKVCRIPEEDLDHIVMSFLIMSVERKYVIHSELQKCLITVLDRFFAESWPIYRLTIANSLGSLPNTNFLNDQWLYVYEMVKAIPIASFNGDQLRKYICVRILLNLTDHDNNQSTEYSEELFSLSTLMIIFNSLGTSNERFQHVVIKFLDILVNHLKFTIEEYEQLCKQLKIAQKNFPMSSNLLDLELIHSRIHLSNLNIKKLKPLRYKRIQLKYAESDDAMSDDEILPNVEDAHDDIPAEREYSGILSSSQAVEILPNVEDVRDDIPPEMEYSGMLSSVQEGEILPYAEDDHDDIPPEMECSRMLSSSQAVEIMPNVEDAHDDIPPELEYCGMLSSSSVAQKNDGVSETTKANYDEPKNPFEIDKGIHGAFVNETEKMDEISPNMEYFETSSASNFTQRDNVLEKTETNSEKPNCLFGASKETTGALINETDNMVEVVKSIKEQTNANVSLKRHPNDPQLKIVVEGDQSNVNDALELIRLKCPPSRYPMVSLVKTNMITSTDIQPESLQLKALCQSPHCEENGNYTSGQQKLLKVGEENGQMVTTMTDLSNTKEATVSSEGFDCLDSGFQMDTSNETFPQISDYFSAPKLVWNEHSYSNVPKETFNVEEGIDFPLENSTSMPNVVDLKNDQQHLDPTVPDSEFEIILTENRSLKVIHKSTLKTMIIPTSDLESFCANILHNQNSTEFKISMTESGSLKIMETSSFKTITITASELETYCVDMLKTQNAVEIQSKIVPVEEVCETENNLIESSIRMDKEMDSVSLSKDISLNNYFFESIVEIEPEDPLAKETIVPQISNQSHLLLSLKSNGNLNNLNFKESDKLKTANSKNPQVSNNEQLTTSFQILEDMEGLSSKESNAIKEEVSEVEALLIPEIHSSTSKASTNDNLADCSLPSVKLKNLDSSQKESSSKTILSTDEFSIKAPPTIIQSNLNIPKHLVESNLPVYSTDICKQILSPANLVEEIPEIAPAIQSSTENCQKASDNSLFETVYSTGICKQNLSPATLVEEIPETVPIQSAENNQKASDNTLYETLDEQFRNVTASPLSLLNSLDEIYCKSKKLSLSSSLSYDKTSNPLNSDCNTPLPESQTSSSSMPDIVLSSLGSLSTAPKRKLSTGEQNIGHTSQKQLKCNKSTAPKRKLSTGEQNIGPTSQKQLKVNKDNTTTPTLVNVSAESIAGKENEVHRYAALSSFAAPTSKRTPTKNLKINEYFQGGSSRTVKSKSGTNNNDAVVIQVDSSDSEDDCQVVEVKKGEPQLVFLD